LMKESLLLLQFKSCCEEHRRVLQSITQRIKTTILASI
jgi:hypothetical protein